MTNLLYAILYDNRSNANIFIYLITTFLILTGRTHTTFINICIATYLSYRTMKFLNYDTHELSVDMDLYENDRWAMARLLKYWVSFSLLVTGEHMMSIFSKLFLVSFIYNSIKITGLIVFINGSNLTILYDFICNYIFNTYESCVNSLLIFLETKVNKIRENENDNTNYDILAKIKLLMPNTFGQYHRKIKKME